MSARAAGEAEACGLCGAPGARYTCPRCNRPYCSLPCYRSPEHQACAELFYRDAVLAELRGARADSAERQRLLDGLRWLRETEDMDPDLDPSASTSRLWAALSDRQKSDFERRLESGEAATWLREWRPWWERRVVEEVETSGKVQDEHPVVSGAEDGGTELDLEPEWETEEAIPPVCTNITPLETLSARPSPLVSYSVVNVLYAYAFSMRLVNGDVVGEMRQEFVETVMAISETLSANKVYTSTANALQAGAEAVRNCPSASNPFQAVRAMEDASALLAGGSGLYTLAALSHLGRLLGKDQRCRQRERKPGKDYCYRAQKKCMFLLSWVNEKRLTLAALSLEAQQEFTASLSLLLHVEEGKSQLEKAWGAKRPPEKKLLIEELDS
ncbi:zinc finger HIT domain-containing protein 2 isoform X1 [Hypanus sabinus]|uniref:zinc finger HIT domain-containing protein 2 isoform X1 n=1 Tax=Hypanus sabinus TaxID=79690 RepID=UPI0028C43A46|nr:zinc finger HIT domain-containing protein 2 isoform X1 [Hypanus sabinus]